MFNFNGFSIGAVIGIVGIVLVVFLFARFMLGQESIRKKLFILAGMSTGVFIMASAFEDHMAVIIALETLIASILFLIANELWKEVKQ